MVHFYEDTKPITGSKKYYSVKKEEEKEQQYVQRFDLLLNSILSFFLFLV